MPDDMPNDVAAVVVRLARLELELADERQARLAAAAEAATTRQALDQLTRALSDGLGRLEARLAAAADRQQEAQTGLAAAQGWLADLTRHLETAQAESNGWAVAEQEARTVLEQAFWTMRERQAATEQEAAARPGREAVVLAEVKALGHLVEDLAAAVFPVPDR